MREKPVFLDAYSLSPCKHRYNEALKQTVWVPLFLISRLAYLGAIYVPVALTLPLWFLYPSSSWWPRFLVATVEMSGPAFTKLGQWASSRIDMFPSILCIYLSKLQSNAEPHSFEYTRAKLEKAFGMHLNEIFLEFDQTPIGVGAIAQVYRAKLASTITQDELITEKPKGLIQDTLNYMANIISGFDVTRSPFKLIRQIEQVVAIKILHPNAREWVELDLIIMRGVANAIEMCLPGAHWLSLPDEVIMFGKMMHEQLDMVHEAENLKKFSSNFDSWNCIGFPSPLMKLCDRDILVETFVDAVPMATFLNNGPTPFDKQIATLGLTSFLKMLLLDNHVHADLHPGNIMVSFYNKSTKSFISHSALENINKMEPEEWRREMEILSNQNYTPYLYFVDAGLVSTLSPALMINIIDLFGAVLKFNGTLIGSLMIDRSKFPNVVVDRAGFEKTMDRFIQDIKQRTLTLKSFSVSDILIFICTEVCVN